MIQTSKYAIVIALFTIQGTVSLTFRELPKIFSRKYTTPEITFMVRISIWKFVRVPKARLWAHVQSFSLKFSSQVLFVQYTNFERIFWRARETLVKQPPGSFHTSFVIVIILYIIYLSIWGFIVCTTMFCRLYNPFPLMTNGPLYPITQDSSCHGQHTMPRNPWSFRMTSSA